MYIRSRSLAPSLLHSVPISLFLTHTHDAHARPSSSSSSLARFYVARMYPRHAVCAFVICQSPRPSRRASPVSALPIGRRRFARASEAAFSYSRRRYERRVYTITPSTRRRHHRARYHGRRPATPYGHESGVTGALLRLFLSLSLFHSLARSFSSPCEKRSDAGRMSGTVPRDIEADARLTAFFPQRAREISASHFASPRLSSPAINRIIAIAMIFSLSENVERYVHTYIHTYTSARRQDVSRRADKFGADSALVFSAVGCRSPSSICSSPLSPRPPAEIDKL